MHKNDKDFSKKEGGLSAECFIEMIGITYNIE